MIHLSQTFTPPTPFSQTPVFFGYTMFYQLVIRVVLLLPQVRSMAFLLLIVAR